jgi:hypothetical protein
MRLYHRTHHGAAIMARGYRGRSGYFMLTVLLEDVVWFADRPVGEQEVPDGDIVVVDVPADVDLTLYEVAEDAAAYIEWAAPAHLANQWPRRLLAPGELDAW